MRSKKFDQGIFACVVAGVFAFSGAGVAAEAQSEQGQVNRASFTADGEAVRPDDWRHWVFIGSPLTPNALNGGKAPLPETHHVYMEPSAFAYFEQHGEFAEGTQLASEMLLTISEGAAEDGSINTASGTGYFNGEFAGLVLSVKDGERFAEEPGGWAYFSFALGSSPPYSDTAAILPAEACNACHAANAEEDWVFSQFYPILRAAKPE